MDNTNDTLNLGTVNGIIYASADFPDIDTPEIKPQAGIQNAISHLVLHHISDGQEKIQQSRLWRRKVREILQNHQEKILQFFTKPLPNDHPLKTAHIFLTKYGKSFPLASFDQSRTLPQHLKECIIDISGSGVTVLNDYINTLMESRPTESPVSKWTYMSRNLLDYMRDTGDELIRLDQRLKDECAYLDSVAEKVLQITALPNPGVDGFQEMMELYMEKQFLNHPIDTLYWDYIHTLQKYSVLRDILVPQRMANQVEPLCCICMVEPILMAMVPCGHTYCRNCSKKTIVCSVCRQAVTSRLRVFFG